jgi:two-component system, cell cycle sensor histidine kinase and response regulator CckA
VPHFCDSQAMMAVKSPMPLSESQRIVTGCNLAKLCRYTAGCPSVHNNKKCLIMFSGSHLAWRFFMVVLLIISIMAVSIYLWAVPLVQDRVYEIERNSARLALNNIYELADKAYKNLEGYREQALEANQQRLDALVTLAASQINSTLLLANNHGIAPQQALDQWLEDLRHFRYGNNGYLWVVDHQAQMLSHPDDRYQGHSINSFQNPESRVIAGMIASAIRDGEGFYQYQWTRPGDNHPAAKLSFVRDYPQWGLVIGSGLYLDDLDADIQTRKQQALEEIRQALASIRIASTGYLFVFDAEGQILAHPNRNIDRTNATDLIDPASGRPIVEELIEVADSGHELSYRWDKPDDPGHYRYEKLSIVRRMDSLGWYICATVYVDELQQSARLLSKRIIGISAIAILLALILALYFINLISQPIQRLAQTAERVRRGDLSARSGIVRQDEIGTLAHTFDTMISRLHHNIETLDQTVQKRTRDLTRIEERQRLILDALPAQIACLDQNLIYRFVNRGYALQFNLTKEDLLGHPIEEVIPASMFSTISEALERCLGGEHITYEYCLEEHGKPAVTRRQLIPDYNRQGEIQGLLVLSIDITQEREAERRLLEAQRMQATGQLAGGLAHDFNNLLTIILGNLNALDHHQTDTRHIDPALRATHRAMDITARLLAFARRQPLSPEPVNVQQRIHETLLLVKTSLPGTIHLNLDFAANPFVMADASQFDNCLINLIINARDACLHHTPEHSGEINIYLSQRQLYHTEMYDEAVSQGTFADIRISDTGPGFCPEALQRAFEPFFTTRNGHGSGLGLSMVFGFVKQSGGYIRAHNTTRGASIDILLPITVPKRPTSPDTYNTDTHTLQITNVGISDLASDAVTANAHSNDKHNQEHEHALILLIEDDTDLRRLLRRWLVAEGYTVLESANSEEAAQLLQDLDNISLMLTDIELPGPLNGLELARRCHQQYPQRPVLLISSLAPLNQENWPDNHRFLLKPFERNELTSLVHGLLPETAVTTASNKTTRILTPVSTHEQ